MSRFEGAVDHLRVMVCRFPTSDSGAGIDFLMLYDTVPGGTGYLKQMMTDPDNLLSVFRMAREALVQCACNADPLKDGCYLFLYMTGETYEQIILEREAPPEPVDTTDFATALSRDETRSRRLHDHGVFPGDGSVLPQSIPELDTSGAVDVEVPAGHYSVHDAFLLHGSNPNASTRRRCGITVKYVPTHVHLDRSYRGPTGFDWGGVRLYLARGRPGNLTYAN